MSDSRLMPKGPELRDERITIRVPASVRKAIEREAELQMRSVSDVIILAVSDALGLKRKRKGGR